MPVYETDKCKESDARNDQSRAEEMRICIGPR